MGFINYLKTKSFLGVLFVIVLASALRLYALGHVPYGFANDEVSYIISGYSIALTNGYDLMGKFFPLSINLDSSLSPIPVYLIALFAKLGTLTPFLARLPFSLLGIGTVLLLYLFVDELFKDKVLSFISALLLSISSWHILVTRGVWDVIPAQFFYLLGVLLFVKNLKSGKNILWSIIPFTIAFYSYHGTKVFFVGLIILFAFVYWKLLLRIKKQALLFFLFVIALVISFLFISSKQEVSRQNEVIFKNEGFLKDAKKNVDFNRERSLAPEKLRDLANNKLVYAFDKVSRTYMGAFSSDHLFHTGDINPINGYGTFFKGVLYLVDLPFLILGVVFIFINLINKKNDKYFDSSLLVLGLVLISPLPSALGAGTTYIIRSFMLAPFLAVIIAIGIYNSFNNIRSIKYIRYLIIPTIVIYSVFFGRFLYQYYYQFNFYGGEYWNRSHRILSEYILANKDKYNEVIIGQATDRLFLQYSFFSHSNPTDISNAWRNRWPMQLGNVKFSDTCGPNEKIASSSGKILYIAYQSCEETRSKIDQIVDPMEEQRVIWNIYE